MKLSVVCPIYNEKRYIEDCIHSIVEQDFLHSDMEVLFVDGMSDDGTREVVSNYTKKYPFIKLLDNPQKIVPYAMNRGIMEAKGEFIVRLDAHAEYPKNYFSKLISAMQQLDGAENVGGVCLTLPCNSTARAQAIAAVLSSPFGMGNSYFRIGCNEVKSVDTVPFGCFRKKLFEKIGFYDTELIRNQDDELNGRIVKNGGKIYLLPELEIRYFARDKVTKVWRMFYQYGLYKPLVNKKLGAPATLRQFFPLLFVIGLIVGGALSLSVPYIVYPYFAVLLLYFAIAEALAVREAKKSSCYALLFWMPIVFVTVHVAYGWGYLVGLMKIILKRPFNVESNR